MEKVRIAQNEESWQDGTPPEGVIDGEDGYNVVADPDGEYIYLSDGERDALSELVREILNSHPGKVEWPGGATWPRA